MNTLINVSKHDIPLDVDIQFGETISICCNEKGKSAVLEYTDQHLIEVTDLFDEFISRNADDNEGIETFSSILEKYLTICKRVLNRKIESPIEEMFWKAATEINTNTIDNYPRSMIPGITYQVPIKNYRVDFAIPHIKMVIEIDGHDYHKTKTQRTKDAKRERDLKELGWYVIRFTGSEIYKDVNECINQVRRLAFQHSGNEVFKDVDE